MFWMAYFGMRASMLASEAPTADEIFVLNFCLGLFLSSGVGMSLPLAGLFADDEPA